MSIVELGRRLLEASVSSSGFTSRGEGWKSRKNSKSRNASLGATNDTTAEPRLEIRLGGIYALERIAKDSPERDYSTVIEVLTAYVRENAPWPPKSSKSSERDFLRPPGVKSVSASASDETAEQDESAEQNTEPSVRIPTTDIQAILNVLTRLQEAREPTHQRVILDLRGANLNGANPNGADLNGAILAYASLQGTFLREADLQEAMLFRADLGKALLEKARLGRADLQGADLRGAGLRGADLHLAYLPEADLREAKVTAEQLDDTLSLEGSILPDGSEHP